MRLRGSCTSSRRPWPVDAHGSRDRPVILTIMKRPKPTAGPSADTERDRNAKKSISYNRKARHDYEIEETYDAGLVLVGTEVKSLRAGRVNLQDAFCRIENGEAWLYNMHITPYEMG